MNRLFILTISFVLLFGAQSFAQVSKAANLRQQPMLQQQIINALIEQQKAAIIPLIVQLINPISLANVQTSTSVKDIATAEITLSDIVVNFSLEPENFNTTVSQLSQFNVVLNDIDFVVTANGQVEIESIANAKISQSLSFSGQISMIFNFDIVENTNTSAPVLQNFQVTNVQVSNLGVKVLLTSFFGDIGNSISHAASSAGNAISGAAKSVGNVFSNTANQAGNIINQIGNIPQTLQQILDSQAQQLITNQINNNLGPSIEAKVNAAFESNWFLRNIYNILHYGAIALIVLLILAVIGFITFLVI